MHKQWKQRIINVYVFIFKYLLNGINNVHKIKTYELKNNNNNNITVKMMKMTIIQTEMMNKKLGNIEK